jgi:hypothetical protein
MAMAQKKPDPPVKKPEADIRPVKKSPAGRPKVLMLQARSDWNRAFDQDGDQGLMAIFKSIPEIEVEHHYIESSKDIIRIINGIHVPLAHLVIMAHGNSRELKLSDNDYIEMEHSSLASKYRKANIYEVAEAINNKLPPGGSIFLHSCQVGEGGINTENIAQLLAVLTDRKIYGSEQAINRGDLLVTKAEITGNVLDMQYIVDNDQVRLTGRQPYNILEFKPQYMQGGGWTWKKRHL